MAVLYITEYAELAQSQGNPVAAGEEPAIATQTVAIGGASTPSAAFNAATRFVRLHTDAICSVTFGITPVATTASPRMAANQTEFFGAISGFAVAVIANT